MPTSTAIRPTAKVMLPHQSIRACWRTPVSCSFRYAQIVPITPNGTDTRKIRFQSIGASTPPTTRPRNEPAMAATPFMPSARPRWLAGKASVRIADEFAIRKAPPTPCTIRQPISHNAAASPSNQVTASMIDDTVKTAKPRLYILARPYMSPSRPKLTTSTAVTTRKPMIIHSR
jgi:hypothetical protein